MWRLWADRSILFSGDSHCRYLNNAMSKLFGGGWFAGAPASTVWLPAVCCTFGGDGNTTGPAILHTTAKLLCRSEIAALLRPFCRRGGAEQDGRTCHGHAWLLGTGQQCHPHSVGLQDCLLRARPGGLLVDGQRRVGGKLLHEDALEALHAGALGHRCRQGKQVVAGGRADECISQQGHLQCLFPGQWQFVLSAHSAGQAQDFIQTGKRAAG